MTKTELFSLVDRYMHRSNDSQNLEDWLKFAESRIAKDVRAWQMRTSTTLDEADRVNPAGGRYNLPADFLEVIRVTNGQTGREVRPAAGLEFSQFARASFQSEVYYMEGLYIIFNPTPKEGNGFGLTYFRRPEPITDTPPQNLDPVLIDDQPELYMYAMLREGATWARDQGMFDVAYNRYRELVDEINRIDERRSFGPGIGAGNNQNFGSWSGTNGGM